MVAAGSDADLAAAVDLDLFLKESVGRSVMGSLDCLSCDGNNYYLHQGSDGVWRIVPWDFDVDLGVWYMTTALAVDPRAPWVSSPWAYDAATYEPYTDPLLTRQLAMGADVDAEIAALLAGPLAYDAVTARIAAAADLIRADVHADVLGYGARFEQRVADLHLFLHSRLSALSGGEVADCAPLPGLPLSFFAPSGTVGWGALLVDATNWGPGVTVNGAHACTGVFAHAPSTVTVTIPDGYATLSGAVGLQDWNQQCGDGARFRVEQGGAVLWQSDVVRNYDDAVPFSVAIGAGALSLVADPVTEYSCDTAVWVDVAVGQ